MLHLIYVSTALYPFRETELEALLAQSRAANGAAEVTGLLVYGGGNFMQLLEGPEAAVRDIFARIERDQRHCDTTVIVELETGERWCAEWAMAYAHLPDGTPIDGFLNLVGERADPLVQLGDDNIARKLMQEFLEGNR